MASFLPVLLTTIYAGAVLFKVLQNTPLNILYTYHPMAACLALPLAALGIFQTQKIRGPHTAAQKEAKTQTHAIIIWLAVFAFITSFSTIYLNKENKGKPHATTVHGKGGFFVVIMFVLQALGSAVGYNAARLTFFKSISQHRIGGYVVFTAALAVHGSAVWFGYTGYKSLEEKSALLAVLAASGILSLLNSRRPVSAQKNL